MLVLVGNSPSSGSTLLSELLDSTSVSMSGEELGLFANKHFYSNFKNSAQTYSLSKSIYTSRNGLFQRGLSSYGMSEDSINALLQTTDSNKEFVNRFIDQYKSFRNKDATIMFEKTPQNLNCIGEFLESFDDSYFIHIVRNPLYVYNSLLRRNFSPYVALITWLIDVASFHKYRNHKRVITIKYEDLLKQPFKCTSELIQKVSKIKIPESDIEEAYKKNKYREKHTLKIDSWSNKEFGTISSSNLNKKIEPQVVKAFSAAKFLEVSPQYAEKFGLEETSYIELINFYGYEKDIELMDNVKRSKTLQDLNVLFRKFYHDLKNQDAKIKDVMTYLNPVISTRN